MTTNLKTIAKITETLIFIEDQFDYIEPAMLLSEYRDLLSDYEAMDTIFHSRDLKAQLDKDIPELLAMADDRVRNIFKNSIVPNTYNQEYTDLCIS